MFGEFIRKHRLSKDLSLRQFCSELDVDASHWSKIERGLLAPPKSETMMSRIAEVLSIVPESQEWYEMHDFAALESGRLPSDILGDEELVKCLPLVFRTVRNAKPTDKELTNLAEIIRQNIGKRQINRLIDQNKSGHSGSHDRI